ncbi:MAG TPA: hypothetical protein VKG25_07220 [Bryobacteraceae bacterium]|nr:hypothetical protein [Bryobacteraceae bacterium]
MPLQGVFWVFVLFDVAEQIRLDELRGLAGAEPVARQPKFTHPAPDYVRFEQPPVVFFPDLVVLATGERFQPRLKFYDYGVVSVELRLEFTADWDSLIQLSNRWISAPELERRASELLRSLWDKVLPAMEQPYETYKSEDYYVIQLVEPKILAAELLASHGAQIAQIVRGESQPLSPTEQREVLQSSMSYFPSDLMVAGWVAALVCDSEEGAATTIQLLEYANTQLLEFRHYDDVLTKVLQSVYKKLDQPAGLIRRWRMARDAERLNRIRLDVTELTERTETAIKFLSDMFYARVYRVAADRVGVADYRNLVEEKLRTAGDLYDFMVNEFHQARAFVLEVLVVAILVIELVHLFR